MYPLKKGKTANQAHVGLPEGTFEEEHGRKGFYGKSAHLYHAHPPTGWIRFEGKLRPHCFDLNELQPADLSDAEGMPVAFLGNDDIRLYVSRRSEPMPFYFRNADGDELYFVHRGQGKIETDFGPLDFEPGDYINIPACGHLPRDPRNARQFLPDHSIQVRIRAARQRTAGPARALRSRHHRSRPSRRPCSTITPNGRSASKWTTRFRKWCIRSIPSTWWAGRVTSRSGKSTCATSAR